jgi:hypothetical protein
MFLRALLYFVFWLVYAAIMYVAIVFDLVDKNDGYSLSNAAYNGAAIAALLLSAAFTVFLRFIIRHG